jgi:ubiquinone/menaquinone biosynthesis C-methylase UbiE
MPRTKLFLSYSHRDKNWLEQLQWHLKPLERDGLIDRWDDTRIRPGADWRREIADAVNSARIVVLLVSAHYLGSEFINNEELPPLLTAAQQEGAVIIPVILSACLFEETRSLSRFQSINEPSQPLNSMNESDRDKVWVQLARTISHYMVQPAVARPESVPAAAPDGRAAAQTPPAPEPPAAIEAHGRHALLVINDRHDDPVYDSLVPHLDESVDLAAVLGDPQVGEFSVSTLRNLPNDRMVAGIRQFFGEREPGDLALLYFYGPAIRDDAWGLYFPAINSRLDQVGSAFSALELAQAMARSRAQHLVALLDCVYAGSYGEGARPADCEANRDFVARFQGEGRFVFSAPESLRLAWQKGTQVPKPNWDGPRPEPPLIHSLIPALCGRQADLDQNGRITADEFFVYLEKAVGDGQERAKPVRWAFDQSKADVVIADATLPGQDRPPPSFRKRYSLAQDIRQPILDLTVPTYILDDNFYFLDWNSAFDLLIAGPLRLVRGRDHAGVFVQNLVNCEDVVKHAKERFGGERHPLTDTEILVFRSPSFGELRFRKLAAQITDDAGRLKGWSVSLNLVDGADNEALWKEVMARIEEEVGWSRYAMVYDELLLQFPAYLELVAKITGAIGPEARRVIDLGPGTGNGALQLLRDRKDREVWAVEINETMLRAFRAKLADAPSGFGERLTILKDDITRLDSLPPATYDAAVMINVLYAVRDREACLRNVNRILKAGGILVLSTPHQGTNVKSLFDALQDSLDEQGVLDEYQEQVEAAWARHEAMSDLIHRDTIAQILELLRRNGFEPGDPEPAYIDSVIVVRSRKVRDLPEPTPGPIEPTEAPPTIEAKVAGAPARPDEGAPRQHSPEVFISYSNSDLAIADGVRAYLESQAIPCWFAARDLDNHEDYPPQIVRAIGGCRVLIVILSKTANQSKHTPREVALAADRNIPILPLRVAEIPPSEGLAYHLINVSWLDAFPPPLEQHLPRLGEKVKAILSRAAASRETSS